MLKTRLGQGVCAAIAVAIMAPSASAYTPTLSSQGEPIRWNGSVHLNFAGNPANKSGMSDAEVRHAVVRGLQRWSQASGGAVGFDYWQGADPGTYTPTSALDGLSMVYFASQAQGGPAGPATSGLSSNVLGLTQVWYSTESHQILEADIILNDINYRFTTDPSDTSGYGTPNSHMGSGSKNVFLENVVTHELGHALGLSHSGGLHSTMLFMESPEQAFLGCDDQTAIHALYPTPDAGQRGEIFGSVNQFGAHVLAISQRRGTVMASALSNSRGEFRISALEPGTYYLLVEPFFAGSGALPAYYSGIQTHFARTLLLQPVRVRAGESVRAPSIQVQSNSIVDGALIGGGAPDRVIYDGTQDHTGGFGAADRLQGHDPLSFQIKSVEGELEVHALAYGLYSPVGPRVRLLDEWGREYPWQSSESAYVGRSGLVDHDVVLKASSLPQGDYRIEIMGSQLNASLYPAGPISLDPVPFIVVTGSLNASPPPLVSTLSENARCKMNEQFSEYQSPPGPPPRRSLVQDRQNDQKEESGGGFCSTTQRPPNSQPPSGWAILSWILPWLAMAMMTRLRSCLGPRLKLT